MKHPEIFVVLNLAIIAFCNYLVERFSRLARLENQLEVQAVQGRIDLQSCYFRIESFPALAKTPCEACGKTHAPWEFFSIAALMKPCLARPAGFHFFTETAFLISSLLFLIKFGWTLQYLVVLLLLAYFYMITVVDYRYFIIPDQLNYTGIIIGLGLNAALPLLIPFLPSDFIAPDLSFSLEKSILGLLISAGLLFSIAWLCSVLLKRDAMGMGDIKLLAFIGAFLGYKITLLGLALSSVLGSIFGLGSMLYARLIQKREGYTMIAYGPYLILGTLVVLYLGEELILSEYARLSSEWIRSFVGH